MLCMLIMLVLIDFSLSLSLFVLYETHRCAGSEAAVVLDSERKEQENWTSVDADASPTSTGIPSPETGMTGAESHAPPGQEATSETIPSKENKEEKKEEKKEESESQIPQSASGEAQSQSQAADGKVDGAATRLQRMRPKTIETWHLRPKGTTAINL